MRFSTDEVAFIGGFGGLAADIWLIEPFTYLSHDAGVWAIQAGAAAPVVRLRDRARLDPASVVGDGHLRSACRDVRDGPDVDPGSAGAPSVLEQLQEDVAEVGREEARDLPHRVRRDRRTDPFGKLGCGGHRFGPHAAGFGGPSVRRAVVSASLVGPPSSWLIEVELWFSKAQRDVLPRGIFTSTADLDSTRACLKTAGSGH